MNTTTRLSALRLGLTTLGTLALLLGMAVVPAGASGGPDVTPPVITCNIMRTVLWPARNALLPVGFSASAVDDCDGTLEPTIRIYSDQDHGAAPFAPDATSTTGVAGSLKLRSQRDFPAAPGTFGRVYIVTVAASDSSGNTGVACKTSVCPVFPVGSFMVGLQGQAAAGLALCQGNGGVIPPGNGWFLLNTFTLPPPIKAFPDSYDTIGNVTLDVPAASGVLANDTTVAGSPTVTTTGSFPSTNGGTVTMSANGAFTYQPPAGFTGPTDTFAYTFQDAALLTASTTVTIAISDMIWFIDNSNAATFGDGTQAAPFGSFARYTTNATDAAGDVIYVDLGDASTLDYDTGLALLADQELYGEGVSLAASVPFVIPPFNSLPGAGTRPLITNAAGAAITSVGGNTIRGLDVSAPTGAGIAASGTDLTVSAMLISGAGTDGIAFSSVAGTIDIDDVDVNAPGGQGFNLSSCSGSFDFDSACSVTNAAGTDFRVFGGTCAVTYNGDLSQSTAGGLVSVLGSHATGTILFQTNTVGCTSGSGIRLGPCSGNTTFGNAVSLTTSTDAIVLSSSTGTTNFNGLTITATGRGILSSGGGTLNVLGTNNVQATGGSAVDITSAACNVTFSSVTSSGGANGIRLSSCTGSFAVSGLTDIDSPTGHAIAIGTSPSLDIDFATLDIDDDGAGGGDGINISGGVGDFDVSGQTTIDNTDGFGIRIATSPSDTFTFGNTNVGEVTRCDAGVSLTSSAGATFTFSDLDIETSEGAGLVCDTAGTLNVFGNPGIDAIGGAAIDITDTAGSTAASGNFQFGGPTSTDSPDVGIRFESTSETILLTDVDIDSGVGSIENGIVFTDCTGASKTVREGHIVFTATNNANGVLVDNSDNVTIEGDTGSAFDPIGTPNVFTGAFEITGVGTGSTPQTLNGNSTGHHAVCCHDSNGLIVRYCYIHDIGDTTNTDAHLDAGIFIDETTGGTVTITNNHLEKTFGSDGVHLGSPSSTFAGTSTFNVTFNRFVGIPAATPVSMESGIQAAFDSTSGATIVGNFDDNEFEGMSFNGIQVNVELSVTNGNSGTGAGGRNLFSASRNVIEDPDNDGIDFDLGDNSVSRIIIDDNTFDASLNHTSFDFGPQIACEVELRHDGATHTPVLDFFFRNNTVTCTNSTWTDSGAGSHPGWVNHGLRLQTSSATAAGVGTIRSLIDDNLISDCEEQSIEIQSDESNVIHAIVRDNDIDSSDSILSSLEGVIDLDTQSGGDASDLLVWLDGNDTGSPNAGGVDVGYRVEEDTAGNPHPSLACEASCPVSGTITTNADLISLLSHNGNTSDSGGAPTVDSSAGSVIVVTTASIVAPTLRAKGAASRMVGSEIVGETEEDKAPLYALLEVAKALWIDSGISDSDRRILDSISIGVADLDGDLLARTWITHITLDATAAGHGWFLDATPEENREFDAALAAKAPEARGAFDLLTVLLHEIGHALGREHCSCPDHVMSHDLVPGVRRLLAPRSGR